jgi:hypothetical protein
MGWRLVHYHHCWRGMVMMRKMVMMRNMVMRDVVMVGHVGTDTSVHCLMVLGSSSCLKSDGSANVSMESGSGSLVVQSGLLPLCPVLFPQSTPFLPVVESCHDL